MKRYNYFIDIKNRIIEHFLKELNSFIKEIKTHQKTSNLLDTNEKNFIHTLFFLFAVSVIAQPIDSSKYPAPIKVACIGNSITYGSGIPDRPRDSYPSQLARMLGEKGDSS